MFVQTNRRLRAVFLAIKEPEELPVIFPVPAGVADVIESFALDLRGDLVEVRKNVTRRRAFRAQRFFAREPECADAGENLHPGKEEPAERADETEQPTAGDVVDGEKGGDENADRAGLLRER